MKGPIPNTKLLCNFKQDVYILNLLVTCVIQRFIWQQPSAKFFGNINIAKDSIRHAKDPLNYSRMPPHWCHDEVSQIMIKRCIA